MSHTPEPWYVGGAFTTPDSLSIEAAPEVPIADVRLSDDPDVNRADAARIVACVNACTNIADPNGAIAAARVYLRATVKLASPDSWARREALAVLRALGD